MSVSGIDVGRKIAASGAISCASVTAIELATILIREATRDRVFVPAFPVSNDANGLPNSSRTNRRSNHRNSGHESLVVSKTIVFLSPLSLTHFLALVASFHARAIDFHLVRRLSLREFFPSSFPAYCHGRYDRKEGSDESSNRACDYLGRKRLPHSSRVALPSVRCRGKSSFSRYHAMAARLPPGVRASFGKRTRKGVVLTDFSTLFERKARALLPPIDHPTLSLRTNILPFHRRLRYIAAKNSCFSLRSLFVLHFPSLRFLSLRGLRS